MDLDKVNTDGLVLLGCGKMGSALLQGWLEGGVNPEAVSVIDPNPSAWLQNQSVVLNGQLPQSPAAVLVAVKPQMMGDALPRLQGLIQPGVLLLSVAAGTSIATFESSFGEGAAIVRAMPNTPAAIGKGITAMIGNDHASEAQKTLARDLLSAVGQVVQLENEEQIDAVTGLSGGGPAYVFHLIEAMAAAGEAEGLPPSMAMQLAKATVAGAGALAEAAQEDPAQLRVNVTSPGGTTAEALKVLMDPDHGFTPLMIEAVKAAAARGRELG